MAHASGDFPAGHRSQVKTWCRLILGMPDEPNFSIASLYKVFAQNFKVWHATHEASLQGGCSERGAKLMARLDPGPWVLACLHDSQYCQ